MLKKSLVVGLVALLGACSSEEVTVNPARDNSAGDAAHNLAADSSEGDTAEADGDISEGETSEGETSESPDHDNTQGYIGWGNPGGLNYVGTREFSEHPIIYWYQLPALPYDATLVNFGVHATADSQDMKMALYHDAGDGPGAQFAETSAPIRVVDGRNELSAVGALDLTAGEKYWIAFKVNAPLDLSGNVLIDEGTGWVDDAFYEDSTWPTFNIDSASDHNGLGTLGLYIKVQYHAYHPEPENNGEDIPGDPAQRYVGWGYPAGKKLYDTVDLFAHGVYWFQLPALPREGALDRFCVHGASPFDGVYMKMALYTDADNGTHPGIMIDEVEMPLAIYYEANCDGGISAPHLTAGESYWVALKVSDDTVLSGEVSSVGAGKGWLDIDATYEGTWPTFNPDSSLDYNGVDMGVFISVPL